MYRETKIRSIMKTISWRITATVITVTLVYLFTGRTDIAFTIGGIEVIAKMVVYFLHERGWDRVRFGRQQFEPAVLWFTGLSGSGKSTVSEEVFARLKKQGVKVEYLDGDSVRDIFPKTGFSREDREQHVRRVGYLAGVLASNGVTVVASFISPYEASRQFVRAQCKNFIEVHVSTPLEECERRDVKGLYAKARAGEITQFTGIDDPYEIPQCPEITLDTTHITVDDASNTVMKYFWNTAKKHSGRLLRYGSFTAARKQKRAHSEGGVQPVQESRNVVVNR